MGKWFLRHQRSLLFLIVLLTMAGVYVATRLPVAIFPNIQFPRILVSVDSTDMPSKQTMLEITKPLEQVLENVPNVKSLQSTTSHGGVDVSLSFKWGADMVTAMLQVQSAVNEALPDLPPNTTFTVTRMDPASRQMMGFSLTSSPTHLVALKQFANTQIRPLLATVPGIARVEILGGHKAEYHIAVNPYKLKTYGLTMSDLAGAISQSNIVNSVGKVNDQYQLYLLVANAPLRNLHAIKSLPITIKPHVTVRLGQIASVTQSTKPNYTSVTANGKQAVIINLYQQEKANTVAIVKEVNKRLKSLYSKMPANMHLSTYYDQSQLILKSANSVRDAIVIGAVLAGLVLFVFLRNVRLTLVVALVLPIVLAITTLLLYMFKMSFNIMTLGGMAAAVGLIIDDGVVMLEHIIRRVEEKKVHSGNIMQTSLEIIRPLMGSSLATIIIFLPLAFLQGFTGGFFKALALTMSSALIVSYLVVLIAVPLITRLVLKNTFQAMRHEHGNALQSLYRAYRAAMTIIFNKQYIIWFALLVFLGLGIYAFLNLSTGFIPPVDEGVFVLDYQTPPGTSLAETNILLKKVEAIIMSNPNVKNYSRRTGLQMGGGLTEPNTGDIYIHLKGLPRQSVEIVMNEVTNQIQKKVPGFTVLDTIQLMEDMIGDLTDSPEPIEVKIFGPNHKTLQQLAIKLSHQLENIPLLTDVNSGIVIAGSTFNINVNKLKASYYGLSVGEITQQIQNQMMGIQATTIPSAYSTEGVRVISKLAHGYNLNNLQQLPIMLKNGKSIPLSLLASFQKNNGTTEIDREDLQQMIAVTAGINGSNIKAAIKIVKQQVATLNLPADYYVSYGGLYKAQQKSFKNLLLVFLSALLMIKLLLKFLYERFSIVFSIVFTALFTLPGIFIGLWVTQTELDVSSMMGMTMILGIVTEIAIFYFAELISLRHINQQGIIQVGVIRLRPILMTSLIAILALLPLAMSDTMQTPLAISIISGLIVAVPLVLFVMPLFYYQSKK